MTEPKFKLGDRVTKIRGSMWRGRVVGTYSTELTPEGYCVESFTEKGSVQIYPASALEELPPTREQIIAKSIAKVNAMVAERLAERRVNPNTKTSQNV